MTGRQGAGWPRPAAPHFSEAGWPLLRGLPFQKLPGLRAPSLPPPPCKVGPHLPPSGVPSVMVTWERMYRPGERHAQATKPAQGQTDMPLIGRMAMSKPCVSRLVTVRAGPPVRDVHTYTSSQRQGRETGCPRGTSARPGSTGRANESTRAAHVCKHPQTRVHTVAAACGTHRRPWTHQPTRTRSPSKQKRT